MPQKLPVTYGVNWGIWGGGLYGDYINSVCLEMVVDLKFAAVCLIPRAVSLTITNCLSNMTLNRGFL